MIKYKVDYTHKIKTKGTLSIMIKRSLKYKLLTVGMIAGLVIPNFTAVQVYASENVGTEQPVGTQNTIEIMQEAPAAEVIIEDDTEEKIDAYYAESVFVGDSIMRGFRNYCMKQKGSFLNNIQFLASGSFSVTNSLWDITEKSVHPVYQGEKRQIWDSISMMNVKRVFLFLGMNDLNVSGLEGTVEKYKQLIANTKEKSPDVEIHIMSMTYTLKGAGKGKLNNDTIREFNVLLQEMVVENGWGYMDMATPLADANGDLAAPYCSDGFVHQTNAAYDVWTGVIRQYARLQLGITAPLPSSGETSTAGNTTEVTLAEQTTVESPVVENTDEVISTETALTEQPSDESQSVEKNTQENTLKEKLLAESLSNGKVFADMKFNISLLGLNQNQPPLNKNVALSQTYSRFFRVCNN